MTSEPVEPIPAVEPLAYRRVVGRFTTGIAVVTASLDGADFAMTVNSFTSVSLDPLQVLFCCEKASRLHRAIAAGAGWGVSVLSDRQREVAQWFATRGRPLEGQFRRVPHHRGPVTGAVLLSEALSTLECRTTGRHEGGDHTIVVGEVLAVALPRPDGLPLLYFAGDYERFSPTGGAETPG